MLFKLLAYRQCTTHSKPGLVLFIVCVAFVPTLTDLRTLAEHATNLIQQDEVGSKLVQKVGGGNKL